MSRRSREERKEILSRAIARQLAKGNRRVESQTDNNAVIVAGKPVNDIFHLTLTGLTLGLWAVVWGASESLGGEKREMITIDEYGNTLVQKL